MRNDGLGWREMQSLEWDLCKGGRARRQRVLLKDDLRHNQKPSVGEPYIHPYNMPKHHALQLRTLQFGKARGRQLLYLTLQVRPIIREGKALAARRCSAVARSGCSCTT